LRAHFLVELGGKYSEQQTQRPAFVTIAVGYGSSALSCPGAGERMHGVWMWAGEEFLWIAGAASAKRRFAAQGGA
jgi:hypothetical protein